MATHSREGRSLPKGLKRRETTLKLPPTAGRTGGATCIHQPEGVGKHLLQKELFLAIKDYGIFYTRSLILGEAETGEGRTGRR